MAYLLLAVLIVLVGVPSFRRLKATQALAVTSCLPPVLFQAGNWLYLGYLDPFWPIAGLVCLVASAIGAVAIGMMVGRFR